MNEMFLYAAFLLLSGFTAVVLADWAMQPSTECDCISTKQAATVSAMSATAASAAAIASADNTCAMLKSERAIMVVP